MAGSMTVWLAPHECPASVLRLATRSCAPSSEQLYFLACATVVCEEMSARERVPYVCTDSL